MRPRDETDAESREYADRVIVRWEGTIPAGEPRIGPPCLVDGCHEWWHIAAAKAGIRELPDGGRYHRYLDTEEHDECAWCGKWKDAEAFRRSCRQVGMP